MNKRIISILLGCFLLMGMALPAYATETDIPEEAPKAQLRISTPEEFVFFAENCRLDTYSQNLSVTLEENIDLTGLSFSPIPIFSGTFDGNGHTISGLSITANGSSQGLFRFLTATAVVQELSVSGNIQPGGSRSQIGGIAGHNAGYILDCSFLGQLSGGEAVGGIAGVNAVTGIIEGCQVSGEIHGDHFVGGISGDNSGVIRDCANSATVNTTPQQNDIEITDITMDTLTNTEAANTVTDIGGIAGSSSGVIRDCENSGDVGYQHIGYNIGGIAGTQSGYIQGCENRGHIQGRKEVGGIVGQMEPSSLIEYSEDTLQLLEGQLGDLSVLVNRASANAQANASQIGGQLDLLQEQAQAAQDAMDVLFPDEENPEIPDLDAILAAQNALAEALDAMPNTLRSIATAAQTTVNALGYDLGAISVQVDKMGETVNNSSENLGGSLLDVSDQDSAEMLTGKVESCTNFGNVLADLNAGGIAGAMAMENDMDILEDWQQQGEQSLNFESKLRAVLLQCVNHGAVTGKRQNVGGIVGWQPLGLVKSCTNTGNLIGTEADYVGGISGLSAGYIRANYARCEIHGKAYVGGIAGSGTTVTDCISMVQLLNGAEKIGAILGSAAESQTQDTQAPIAGNIYPALDKDMGGIDGISYAGVAEGVTLDAFLAQEALPELYRTVVVSFVFEDDTETEIDIPTGGNLTADQIPTIPTKDGFTAKWDGLEDAALESIFCDVTFTAVYTACHTTIQSEQVRDNGLPIVLAEGALTEDSRISAEKSDAAPGLKRQETLLESWKISVPNGANTIRLQLPDSANAEQLKLLIQNAEGTWNEAAFSQNGRYIVISASGGETQLALVQTPNMANIWLIIGAGIAPVLVITVVLVKRRKKSKQEVSNA